MKEKIGMYTYDEILEHLTDGEGRGFLGRSMYDAIVEEINKKDNIINELEKELKEDYKIWMCNSRSNGKSVKFGIDVCKLHFYNRLQKLKGDKSNDN